MSATRPKLAPRLIPPPPHGITWLRTFASPGSGQTHTWSRWRGCDVLTRGCRLSLRFAKPSAAIAGASTETTLDDADVDPAHFTVVLQEVSPWSPRVGTSAEISPQVMRVSTSEGSRVCNSFARPNRPPCAAVGSQLETHLDPCTC